MGEEAKESRAGDARADEPLTETEQAELARLRAENPELRMQLMFAEEVAIRFAKDRRSRTGLESRVDVRAHQ